MPHHPFSRTRRVSVKHSVLAVAVVLAAAVTGSSSASAATTTPPVKEAVTGWNYNSIWAGNYRLDAGKFPVYCIKAYASYPTGTYSGAVDVPASPTAARIGWVINAYGKSKNPDVEAAVAALIGLHYDVVDTTEKWNAVTAAQRDLAKSYWAAAAKYAGPYKVVVNVPSGLHRTTAANGSVSVQSATGTPIPAFALKLAASGASLVSTTVVTNSKGVGSFSFSIPASNVSGKYSVSATGSAVAGVVEYNPTGSGPVRQIVMGAADPSVQSGSSTAGFATTRPVTLTKYRDGDAVKAAVAGASYQLKSVTGQVLSTVTTASTPVSLGSLTEGATYQLVEVTAPAGFYIKSSTTSFTVGIGAGSQAVAVADPAVPVIALSTSLSPDKISLGGTSRDLVTLSGNDGEVVTVTYTLVGPVKVGAGKTCTTVQSSEWDVAPVVQSGTAVLGSDNTTTVVTPALSEPGCYSYEDQASLDLSGAVASSAAGSAGEVLTVEAPAISTSVVTKVVRVGTAIRDQVVLSGLGDLTASLTGNVVGPVPPVGGNCDGLDYSRANVVDSFGPIDVNATSASPVVTPPSVPSVPGCYSFGETALLSSGQVLSSEPGTVGESVLVVAAPVSSGTHPAGPAPRVPAGGGPVSDSGSGFAGMKLILLGALLVLVGGFGFTSRRSGSPRLGRKQS